MGEVLGLVLMDEMGEYEKEGGDVHMFNRNTKIILILFRQF